MQDLQLRVADFVPAANLPGQQLAVGLDGDGRLEYVPRYDQVGPNLPDHSYQLFTNRAPYESGPKPNSRFYLGGKVYSSWSAVPDAHKVPRAPGTFSDGAQFSIFTFLTPPLISVPMPMQAKLGQESVQLRMVTFSVGRAIRTASIPRPLLSAISASTRS